MKIQISICINAVLTESSLGTFWIEKDAKFLNADNKDSDQTAGMHLHLLFSSKFICSRVQINDSMI